MRECKKTIHSDSHPACFEEGQISSSQQGRPGEYVVPPAVNFNDVIRIAEGAKAPTASLLTLLDLIGKQCVVQGLWRQGDEKFKETLEVFNQIGISKCIEYLTILNDEKAIGKNPVSRDFARAPYSIARTLDFIHSREIEIEDIHIIVPKLKDLIGEQSVEKGLPSWSLFYFFVALKKIKTIGIERSVSIILFLKKIFGNKYVCDAYEKGYLWFVEALEILSQIDRVKCENLIRDFRDRSNRHYFNIAFAHNPRSFARYIEFKSKFPDKDIKFTFAEHEISGEEIITFSHEFLDKYFCEKHYLDLAPSELIAFIFDAVTRKLAGEEPAKIAFFLENKYFAGLAKRKVYSVLSEIGPEIEIQKDLSTYDVDAAHMVAFFFLIDTSGDGLIEFPLGPANYHGSLSEVVRAMCKISLGDENLIPLNKIIPLDVSLSIPPDIINQDDFKNKANLLRIVNDFLYTAEVRLASAFHGYPQDTSGIRFKTGLARAIKIKGFDLVENRSGNLITASAETSILEPLESHEKSFEFYQIMYSSLSTMFLDESKLNHFKKSLREIFKDFEKNLNLTIKEYNLDYIKKIENNKNKDFTVISHVRKHFPDFHRKLYEIVNYYIHIIDHEIIKEALNTRIKNIKKEGLNIKTIIKKEIELQKKIDLNYGNNLDTIYNSLEI